MTQPRHLDPTYLAECFEADFEAGTLVWRTRPAHHFAFPKRVKAWNSRYAGRPALNNLSVQGYRVGTLDNQAGIRAHRVLFILAHGYSPSEVDHLNGDKADNRATNLRDVSHILNMRNVAMKKNNTSGVCGVVWNRQLGNWRAKIGLNGKTVNLGSFKSLEDAALARSTAEAGLGFGPAHGLAA